eukprot:308208_1
MAFIFIALVTHSYATLDHLTDEITHMLQFVPCNTRDDLNRVNKQFHQSIGTIQSRQHQMYQVDKLKHILQCKLSDNTFNQSIITISSIKRFLSDIKSQIYFNHVPSILHIIKSELTQTKKLSQGNLFQLLCIMGYESTNPFSYTCFKSDAVKCYVQSALVIASRAIRLSFYPFGFQSNDHAPNITRLRFITYRFNPHLTYSICVLYEMLLTEFDDASKEIQQEMMDARFIRWNPNLISKLKTDMVRSWVTSQPKYSIVELYQFHCLVSNTHKFDDMNVVLRWQTKWTIDLFSILQQSEFSDNAETLLRKDISRLRRH